MTTSSSSSSSSSSSFSWCVPSSLSIPPNVLHRRHDKLVIAHRGASYHLPEHTLPAYRLALELGADFIEPDIVATSDGRLIAIHSIDLSTTTNVKELFPEKRWHSPRAGRIGYWAFNFTYHEIQQLRVKQRLPESRSQQFDYIFPIPLLEEIVQELNHWNQMELPLLMNNEERDQSIRRPTMVELAGSGIYLELKEYEWHKEEAKIDLVDLMYDHFHLHKEAWDRVMPCFEDIRENTYKVPGLVIQSFELETLQRFHESFHHENDLMVEPPYVLLVDQSNCENRRFWSKMEHDLMESGLVLAALGPPKECLFPKTTTNNGSPDSLLILEKAQSLNITTLHPWTERPEKGFSSSVPQLASTVMEETEYLFRHVAGVDGIFSESVSTAVTAATEDFYARHYYDSAKNGSLTHTCLLGYPPDETNIMFLLVFVSGFVLATVLSCLVQRCCRRSDDGKTQVQEYELDPLVED